MTSDEQRAASGPGARSTNGTNDSMTSHPANHAANGATDPDRLDLLDRYWDATTGNGFQRAGAIALDPARARTVDLIQTLTNDATAGIPADARARIWRETVATAAIPTRQESPVTASALPGSGAAAPDQTLPASRSPRGRRSSPPPGGKIPSGGRWSVPGGSGPSQPTGRTWWPRLQFAVAAALILGLFATILAPMDDGRVGLFGGIGTTPTADNLVTEVGSDQFGGGSGHQLVPNFDGGLDLRLYRLTLLAGASFDLPSEPAWPTGAVWQFQGFTGDVEFLGSGGSGDPYPVSPATTGGTVNGGRLSNVSDADSQVWLYGLLPRGIELATGSNGVTLRELGHQDVSTLVPGSNVAMSGAYQSATSDPRSLAAEASPPEAGPQPLPGSQTAGVVQVIRGQISIDGLPEGNGPVDLIQGQSVPFEDIGLATVTGQAALQGDESRPATYMVVTVQPYVFGEGGLTVATPAATPVAPDPTTIVPSIGSPDGFTSDSGLVDLPASASGHTVTIDRVLLQPDTTFALPAGSIYFTDSDSGVGTSRNPAPPDYTDESPGLDIRGPIEFGGSLDTDWDQYAIVTVLRLAPDGTPPLTSTDGATVYPLTNYTTGSLRFDSQLNVLFGNGPAPVDPEPVGPSAIADDPTNLNDSGATMLLYAEQGSIRITASAEVIRDREFSPETPEFVSDLTIAAGETAVVSNPSLATIQQATPDEGAVYTAVFLAPPGLDRTVGRTYPNTAGGGTGIQPVPTDGDDYQIVLDRLTLEPGATATFPAGTFRAVQWTGGGLATMVSDETGRPPVVFEERSLNASFEDQGFRIAATGDTPVTLTLMSYLPADSSDETVPTGQAGVTAERLTAYTDTNLFNADHLQLAFYAAEAHGFPMDIAPEIGPNINGINSIDAYALIRPEGGPIVLNRPARRIVDGTETTEIAAGNAVIPGETVRVDDLRDATLQGPTDGTPTGYTLVVVSPYDDPSGNGPNAGLRMPVTGLTPANLDTVVSIPADRPLTMELVQQTIAPGATLTISPVSGSGTAAVPPIAVLSYAATGDGTIGLAGDAGTELSARSNQVAMGSLTSSTPIVVRAGADGLTVYQLVIAPVRPEYDVTGDAISTSVVLGTYSGDDLFDGSGAAGETVDLEITLRSSVGGFGDGSSGTLGRDSAITLLTPLLGMAQITPGTGAVRIVDAASGDRIGAATTFPTTLAPGGSLISLPGGLFRVAAETENDTLSYLSAEIQVSTLVASGTPVATPVVRVPASGTPVEGTPAATGAAACDIKPRTVEEVSALYDEGVANPVDPLTLGHRDDQGTGAPADDETSAGITYTLLRLAACQGADEQLQSFALYSDDALRAVLPLIFQNRDELERVPEQAAGSTTDGANRDVSVSDVEVFADGRVGARVALDSEFAYVTFTQAPDGTWLIDLFDDSDQPGG